MIKLSWTDFKSFITDRKIPIHETKIYSTSYLEAHDGHVSRECHLDDSSTEYTDYVDNYQSVANISPTDSNGISLVRNKITRTGWAYQVQGLDFCTSKIDSLYNADKDGVDLGFTTVRYYDSLGTELVLGTQAELDTNCTKTVVDWMPNYDYEIIGGTFTQVTPPTTNVRLSIIAAPGLPGGDIPFTDGGINIKNIKNELEIDGKTAKLMQYYGGVGSNKFRIILFHDTGIITPINMLFKLYKG